MLSLWESLMELLPVFLRGILKRNRRNDKKQSKKINRNWCLHCQCNVIDAMSDKMLIHSAGPSLKLLYNACRFGREI
jgi:hypothetical protein